MQQTEKYKLNLIESSDPFLPDALNRNTQKIEDAMAAHEEATDEKIAAVASRVTVLEGFKFASGICNVPCTVNLGFTPVAVFVRYHDVIPNTQVLAVTDGSNNALEIVENGFKVKSVSSSTSTHFFTGKHYYIAFGANS